MRASGLTPTFKGYAYVFSGAVLISFASLFVKEAPMAPAMVVFYRLLLGGTALLIFAAIRGERLLPSRRMFLLLVAAAACFSADLTAWHECIIRLGPGLATIMANFQVFFLAFWGAFVLHEKLTRGHKLAIPLALGGLFMLLEVNPRDLPPEIAAGLALGILSAMFYAGYILVLRRSQSTAERLPATANMGFISLLSMLIVGLYCQGKGDSFVIPDLRTLGILALLGIGCQAAGWVLLSAGLPRMPASRAGLVMLASPALSFVWDILFYDRPTGPLGYLGAAVTIAAVGLGLSGRKHRVR
jgi:drug/metabolite transporter (DMT)-like permease